MPIPQLQLPPAPSAVSSNVVSWLPYSHSFCSMSLKKMQNSAPFSGFHDRKEGRKEGRGRWVESAGKPCTRCLVCGRHLEREGTCREVHTAACRQLAISDQTFSSLEICPLSISHGRSLPLPFFDSLHLFLLPTKFHFFLKIYLLLLLLLLLFLP